ncbi:hypothetical protein [Nocardioides sp. B-3]|uniref:hypothetical protein n=1 Tax=Nocardioides sp. B-3 TaxID=2895565 RepID=UPI0021521530|nr:hypothetical protein [Nocardioides sp. B-3]UUZ58957.1 hypothetical protein LP418_23465 [Nocardioides sp. B-3]
MRIWVALGVAAVVLTACSEDGTGGYCESVKEHRVVLSDPAASTEPGAVFELLGPYAELRDEAPRDLRDEWSRVIGRIEALQSALDEAGVDPSTYDPKTTPDGLPAAERAAIRGAARIWGMKRRWRPWPGSSSRPSTCARRH